MIAGWRWPCVVTHHDEIASTIRAPSAVCSAAPSVRTTVGIGSPSPCWVKGCQTGEVMRNPLRGRRSRRRRRSEEHTSELQSLMRISYAVFCLKKKKKIRNKNYTYTQ